MRRKCSKNHSKWLQNGSGSSPGSPRSTERTMETLFCPPGSRQNRLWRPPGAENQFCRCLQGGLGPKSGAIFPSRRLPGRVPESLRDVILGAFVLQGLPVRKGKKINIFLCMFPQTRVRPYRPRAVSIRHWHFEASRRIARGGQAGSALHTPPLLSLSARSSPEKKYMEPNWQASIKES